MDNRARESMLDRPWVPKEKFMHSSREALLQDRQWKVFVDSQQFYSMAILLLDRLQLLNKDFMDSLHFSSKLLGRPGTLNKGFMNSVTLPLDRTLILDSPFIISKEISLQDYSRYHATLSIMFQDNPDPSLGKLKVSFIT
jgi:hypothetical protein